MIRRQGLQNRKLAHQLSFGDALNLLSPDAPSFSAHFYAREMTRLEPLPVQESGPPIWIGSWGTDAGLQRVACLGDGWLASAFQITPESFADGLARLHVFLERAG